MKLAIEIVMCLGIAGLIYSMCYTQFMTRKPLDKDDE